MCQSHEITGPAGALFDPATIPMRECKICRQVKSEDAFDFTGNKPYRRRQCKSCRGKRYPSGVSRQRHLEKRRAREREYARSARGRALNAQAVARWKAKNRSKVAAHTAVSRAIKRGALQRPERCEIPHCNGPARHAHHRDYAHPLDVSWLCPQHHEAEHHGAGGKYAGRVSIITNRRSAKNFHAPAELVS